jgi:hypothetical protein
MENNEIKVIMDVLSEIKDDQKEIRKDQSENKETMIRNTIALETHMARTEANEKLIAALRADVDPLKMNMYYVKGIAIAVSTIFAAVCALIKAGIWR